MIGSFRNIFAIPDLRKRLLFTFALLAVYRIGCNVPTPGVDPVALLDRGSRNAVRGAGDGRDILHDLLQGLARLVGMLHGLASLAASCKPRFAPWPASG